MATNKEKLQPLKNPKRNYKIWIILISFAVILGVFYLNSFRVLPERTYQEFEQMLEDSDVKKITLIKNQEIVEITLTPEAFQNPKYYKYLNQAPINVSAHGPHFTVRIAFAERFDEQFEVLRTRNSNVAIIEYEITNRENYVSMFAQWSFLFLILFCFWMLFQMIGSWLKKN